MGFIDWIWGKCNSRLERKVCPASGLEPRERRSTEQAMPSWRHHRLRNPSVEQTVALVDESRTVLSPISPVDKPSLARERIGKVMPPAILRDVDE
jgi:hypothetical protein